MPRVKLTPERQRAAVKEALSGAVKAQVAREYGISQARLYQLIDDYRDEDRLAEMERDVGFRRGVASRGL